MYIFIASHSGKGKTKFKFDFVTIIKRITRVRIRYYRQRIVSNTPNCYVDTSTFLRRPNRICYTEVKIARGLRNDRRGSHRALPKLLKTASIYRIWDIDEFFAAPVDGTHAIAIFFSFILNIFRTHKRNPPRKKKQIHKKKKKRNQH